MNEKLPKPLLDALARDATPAKHPSADVLAAFAEQVLTQPEKASVAEHLSRCAECREVVFLASAAAREVTEPAGELMAASRGVQTRPITAFAAAAMPRATTVPKLRRWWSSRWVWASSGAAIVVLVGGLVVWQHSALSPTVREVASKSEPGFGNRYPEKSEPEKLSQVETQFAAPQPPKAKAHPATQKATVPRAEKVAPETAPEVTLSKEPSLLPSNEQGAATGAPNPAAESASIAIGGAIANALPSSPTASGFAPNARQAQQQLDSVNIAASRAVAGAARTHSNWRINPQGHLERLSSNGWTRELANEPNTFRAVAVVGSDVWAGGDNGALFHSADNGQHWNKVVLANVGTSEIAAIVSIQFSNAQHGEVTTEGGASYTTSDGGMTWTRH